MLLIKPKFKGFDKWQRQKSKTPVVPSEDQLIQVMCSLQACLQAFALKADEGLVPPVVGEMGAGRHPSGPSRQDVLWGPNQPSQGCLSPLGGRSSWARLSFHVEGSRWENKSEPPQIRFQSLHRRVPETQRGRVGAWGHTASSYSQESRNVSPAYSKDFQIQEEDPGGPRCGPSTLVHPEYT